MDHDTEKLEGTIILYNVHLSYEFYLEMCILRLLVNRHFKQRIPQCIFAILQFSTHDTILHDVYRKQPMIHGPFSENLLAICRAIPISGFCEGIVIQSLQDLGLQCSIGPTMRHIGISPKKGCELILNMFSFHKDLCKI